MYRLNYLYLVLKCLDCGGKTDSRKTQTNSILKEGRKPIILHGIIQCYNMDFPWIQTQALTFTPHELLVNEDNNVNYLIGLL